LRNARLRLRRAPPTALRRSGGERCG
jgi:hypothetical protein